MLYLCYLSPRVTQNIDHKPWVEQDINRGLIAPKRKAKKLNHKNEEDREEWRQEILLGPVYHPDIHVDVSFSWASKCYKELFGGEKGYFTAKSLATEHTGYIWSKFKNKIGAGGLKALRKYDAPMLTWLMQVGPLRKKFDAAMRIR